MTRRIDIELTSDRGDGTWTWRAAGAKQPKGTLEATNLFDGAKVGDVCRADADFAMDGIFIEAVLPPKGRSGKPDAEEIIVTGGAYEGGVTTTWKERKGGGRGDGDRKGGGRGRGRDGGGRGRAKGRDGDNREGGDRNQRGDGRGRGDGEGDRGKPRRDRDRDRDGGGRGDQRNKRGPRQDDRPKPKKLRPGRVHRSAWIDTLPEEQKVVAETISRGGIQAVRKEIETQNEKAKADGSPSIDGAPLLALAEGLIPKLRQAEWRDRADAALADMGEIDLKDLRSVVVAAEDSAKGEESRAVADQLKDGLNARVEAAQNEWVTEINTTLTDGRVVRALRLSSRPPKAGAPLPGDLLQRLTDAANEAVTGDVTQQRLSTVLDAVSRSVVRPNFVLESVPAEPSEELLEMVKKTAAQLPEVAAKFGVTPSRRPRRGGAKKGGPKRPPKPTGPAPAAKETEAAETSSKSADADATGQEAPSSDTATVVTDVAETAPEATPEVAPEPEVVPAEVVADVGEPEPAPVDEPATGEQAPPEAGPEPEADPEVVPAEVVAEEPAPEPEAVPAEVVADATEPESTPAEVNAEPTPSEETTPEAVVETSATDNSDRPAEEA